MMARPPCTSRSTPIFESQAQYIDQLKQGCQLCHQLGNQITRSLGHMKNLNFNTSAEAWEYRVKTGQRGSEMDGMMRRLGDIFPVDYLQAGDVNFVLGRHRTDQGFIADENPGKEAVRFSLRYGVDDVNILRRALTGVPPVEAMELVLNKLKKTGSNIEFLLGMGVG